MKIQFNSDSLSEHRLVKTILNKNIHKLKAYRDSNITLIDGKNVLFINKKKDTIIVHEFFSNIAPISVA